MEFISSEQPKRCKWTDWRERAVEASRCLLPTLGMAMAALDHFKIIQPLGYGSFGGVHLAKHRQTGVLYALKGMSKVDVVEREQVHRVFTELSVLRKVRHPFIAELHASFQSEVNIQLAVVKGGESDG